MSKETPQKMLEDIRSAVRARSGGISLTDWEEGFVENVGSILDAGGKITVAQLQSLEQIWDKI